MSEEMKPWTDEHQAIEHAANYKDTGSEVPARIGE
jgi:hypothetical protein